MALDMTSFAAALKVHYTGAKVKNLTYQNHPFMAMVKKYTKFGGKNKPVPLIYGNPQGRSATFATAKANKGSSKLGEFTLTRVKDYSFASIDGETIEASKGDANALMDASTVEIDGALGSLGASLASALHRDGSGWVGQALAEPTENASTFVITLKNAGAVTQFEVGMVVTIYSAITGGSKRNSDGTDDEWEISAINRDTGALTLTGTYDSSGTITANDYIFVEGDRGLKVSGLHAWIPYSAPSSTAFFGRDRTTDVVRMAGVRMDLSSFSVEEGLIKLAARIGREGGAPDVVFIDWDKYTQLELELGSKVQYVDLKVTAEIGFRGIQINGPKGAIKVIPDPDAVPGYTHMLTLGTWQLSSLGEAPQILDQDGNKMLRETDSDGVEVRCGYYANLECSAPGYNGVGYLG